LGERSSTVIVQPSASRRTVVERVTPSTEELLDATLAPPLDEEPTETELLDVPELEEEDRDEADAPSASAKTVVSITRPSAV
jgi:hypothetical protein